MAYIGIALLIYALYLHAPKDLEVTIVLQTQSNEGLKKLEEVDFKLKGNFWMGIILYMGSLAAFAAVHLLAWNYDFPSFSVAWLWRTSSLVMFVSGCPIALATTLKTYGSFKIHIIPVLILTVPYILSRLSIFVLAFMAFRKAPVSMYSTVNWNMYIMSLS